MDSYWYSRSRLATMGSDIGVRSGFARHGRALMSIIMFQTLLIGWLSLWAVEDYLNNAYVRAYVDLSVQTQGWLLGVLAFTGVLGSVMALVVRRNRHASNSLELVGTGTTAPISTPVPVPGPAMSSKPGVELHPAVAALKAELSERRMSLGLESVAAGPERSAGPSEGFGGQRAMIGTRSSQVIQSPMAGPRPQPAILGTFPQAVNRPIPPTVIRPMLPSRGSVVPSQTPPVLKIAGAAAPVKGELSQGPRPEVSRDAPTVVTGVLPVQEKKKDPDPQAGQSTPQQ